MLRQFARPFGKGPEDCFSFVFRGRSVCVPTPLHRGRCAAAALSALAVLLPRDAHAYVDPNTGGYVFQALFPIVSVIIGWYVFFRDNMKKVLGGLAARIRKLLGG